MKNNIKITYQLVRRQEHDTQLFIKKNISEYIYLKMIISETIRIPTRGE